MMKMKVLNNMLEKKIADINSRADDASVFFRYVVLPLYRKAQGERWQTRGASQNRSWKPLNKKYEASKLIRFQKNPGAGRVTMIATSRLFGSVIGPGENFIGDKLEGVKDHRRIIEKRKMTIKTAVPYAIYVMQKRNIYGFNKEFYSDIGRRLNKWVASGVRSV
jgi:hypothetical protein